MSTLRWLLLGLGLLPFVAAQALIDPKETDVEEQDWMVNVLIKGATASESAYELFCKGTLIHEYWVLSTAACFRDPAGTIADAVGSDKAEYAVALGNLGGFFRVEERLVSPDGNVVLYRLNRPARNQPIRLLYRTATELKGVQLQIFNTETSAALGDALFNAEGNLRVSCNVEGQRFFNNNRMCYVYAPPKFEYRMLVAKGRVIDPLSADAPRNPLNSLITPSTAGNRLYLDFTENRSYPCHEDQGAAITATAGGELVQVGMVVAVGMATGVPLCNSSFANYLITLDGLQNFITSSIARGQFMQQCPARAELKYESLAASRVRFYWDAVQGATGYRALVTTRLGYEPIQSIDLGNIREGEVDLVPGTTYSIALQAYNTDCTGAMSTPITVQVAE